MKEELWECVSGICQTPGAEGLPVFGVRVCRRDGSTWAWPDVDVERAAVERLAALLQAAQPERCHYEEMVLDFIEGLADARR